MRLNRLAVGLVVVVSSCHVDAFQSAFTTRRPAMMPTRSRTTELGMAASSKDDAVWRGMATTIAGWTLATQVAFATVLTPLPTTTTTSETAYQVNNDNMIVMMAPESSTTMTAAVEVMDFSLPSYDASSAKKEAPTFNPFGDFNPEFLTGGDNLKAANEERAAADAAKAEERAAAKAEAEARREEDRLAREARKAEERAEREAADAARKAEREAKRQEELEKQRAAVERQKAAASSEVVEEDVAAPAMQMPSFDIPDFKAPDIKIPDFKAPDIKIPEFKAPENLKMPEFKAPENLKMPEFKAPDVNMKMPEFKAPENLKMPDFKAPDMPKFDMPKFDMPEMPKKASDGSVGAVGGGIEAPKVSLPSMPAFSNPFAGGGSSDVSDLSLESQEVRDEAAREARKVFLAADAEAKEAEAAAKLVRQAANEKSKLAKVAKDVACETRPGGKFLCLRNPFTSGY